MSSPFFVPFNIYNRLWYFLVSWNRPDLPKRIISVARERNLLQIPMPSEHGFLVFLTRILLFHVFYYITLSSRLPAHQTSRRNIFTLSTILENAIGQIRSASTRNRLLVVPGGQQVARTKSSCSVCGSKNDVSVGSTTLVSTTRYRKSVVQNVISISSPASRSWSR